MSDVMLFGVLRMPMEMAMADDLSRMQFYQRAQQAADRIAELERQIAERDAQQAKQIGREPTCAMQAAGVQAIRFDTTLLNKMWTANAVFRAMWDAAAQSAPSVSADKPATANVDGLAIGYFSKNGGSTYTEVDPKFRNEPDVIPLYDRPTATVSADAKDAERYFPYEFEVWQGEVMCAGASGTREQALAEAMRYASQYVQDGPVRVFEVRRDLIAAITAQSKEPTTQG